MKTCYLLLLTLMALFGLCLSDVREPLTEEQRKERRKRRLERKRSKMCGRVPPGVTSNITALWDRVNMLSNPVRVIVHGVDVTPDDVDIMGMEEPYYEEHHHGGHSEERESTEKRNNKMAHRHKKAKSRGHYSNCGPDQVSRCQPKDLLSGGKPDLGKLCPALGKMKICLKNAISRCPTRAKQDFEKMMEPFEEQAKLCIDNHYVFREGAFDHLQNDGEYMSREDEDDYPYGSEEDDELDDYPGGPNIHIHLNMGDYVMKPKTSSGFNDFEYPAHEYVYAKCEVRQNPAFRSRHQVTGTIYFRQKPNTDLEIKADLNGFHGRKPGSPVTYHGFHLHQYGDFSNGCQSFGGHFNPFGVEHGGRESAHRHVGDFGNLESNHRGEVKMMIKEKTSSLFGPHSIAGRGIVIHDTADDHGMGGTDSSKSSGNAGGRIACCVVTYAKGW